MIFTIILLFAICSPNLQLAMEKEKEQNKRIHKYMNVDHILAKDGKYLKQLIARENSGQFSTELVLASGTLKNCLPWDEHYIKEYSAKTIQMATYIGQRIDDLYKMEQAIKNEDIATIENLVLQNPYLINARGFTSGYECPLFMAVNAKKEQAVKKLLKLKANPNMCDKQGNTPLHKPGTYNIAKMLIKAGADVDKKNNNKQTPLFSLVGPESSLHIIRLLREHDFWKFVNKKDYRKNTVLHKAFKYGVDKSIIKVLLEEGADLESRNYKGVTPFDICCRLNYENYSDVLELYGYLYFPIHSSDYISPLSLFRDNASYFVTLAKKPLMCSEWSQAKKSLEKLHTYIRASIHRTQQSRYRSASNPQVEGIFVNQYGCFLKNALMDDCAYFFGQKNIGTMYQILQIRSDSENKLKDALRERNKWNLKDLINEYGIDAGYQYKLMRSSIRCKDNDLSFYLKGGFDPDAHEWDKEHLLFEAIRYNNSKALELLLVNGADFNIYDGSYQARTPLNYIEYLGYDKLITVWNWSLTKRFIE